MRSNRDRQEFMNALDTLTKAALGDLAYDDSARLWTKTGADTWKCSTNGLLVSNHELTLRGGGSRPMSDVIASMGESERSVVHIVAENQDPPLMTLHPDGTVTARDDVAAQEAAQIFMKECSTIVSERDRLRERVAELEAERAAAEVAPSVEMQCPDCGEVFDSRKTHSCPLSPKTLTIARPHVPHGPKGVSANEADVNYLLNAAVNIRHARCLGSNLTNTVTSLLEDVATQIEESR